MKCRDLMQSHVEVCVPHERLLDALEIMGAYDVGWVPVVDSRENRRLMGLVTARGAAGFLGVFDRRPSEAMCREVMSPTEIVVTPEDDIETARARMRPSRFHRLPVVDGEKLAGIISMHDIEAYAPSS